MNIDPSSEYYEDHRSVLEEAHVGADAQHGTQATVAEDGMCFVVSHVDTDLGQVEASQRTWSDVVSGRE